MTFEKEEAAESRKREAKVTSSYAMSATVLDHVYTTQHKPGTGVDHVATTLICEIRGHDRLCGLSCSLCDVRC
eukprot:845205-Rhodomonas_salina.1